MREFDRAVGTESVGQQRVYSWAGGRRSRVAGAKVGTGGGKFSSLLSNLPNPLPLCVCTNAGGVCACACASRDHAVLLLVLSICISMVCCHAPKGDGVRETLIMCRKM